MQKVDENYPEKSPFWNLRYKMIGSPDMFSLSGSKYKILDLVEGRAALIVYDDEMDEDAYWLLVTYRTWLTGDTPEGTFRLDDMFIKRMYIMGKALHGSNDWINRDESVREIFEKVATERLRDPLDSSF